MTNDPFNLKRRDKLNEIQELYREMFKDKDREYLIFCLASRQLEYERVVEMHRRLQEDMRRGEAR
jgi:hypothetical protein